MGGANKLLLELGGVPLVARSADAVLGSAARPVVVVTGHQAPEVRRALAGRELSFVHNAASAEGLAGSLRAGVAALGEEMAAAVVCLGDMPWVRPAHIDALIAAFAASGERAICVPTFEARRGNPVLWPARYFAEIRALTGDRGASALLAAHADEVRSVPVSDPGVTLDVDTPAAWRKLSA